MTAKVFDATRRYPPALQACAVLGAAALVAWLAGKVLDVLLLCFLGLLLAVFLSGVGRWLAQHTMLSHGWATGLFGVALLALLLCGAGLAAPELIRQARDLGEELPRSMRGLIATLRQHPAGEALASHFEDLEGLLGRRETLTRATGIVSSTLGALASVVAVLFIGAFVALEPSLYLTGVLRMAPIARRERLAEVLTTASHTLRLWMFSKLVSMTFVGAATWLGLGLLGVPLALILALLTALLTFIPNFGPVLAAVPPVMLAFVAGPQQALYVIGLYLGVQMVESYLVTPLIERKTVALPPALTIIAQIVMGVLAGGIGLLVATPLIAVTLVFVRMLYVEDQLGDVRTADQACT